MYLVPSNPVWMTSEHQQTMPLNAPHCFLTHTVDGSEIRLSPVEVGSLSHYSQGFIHPRWWSPDFFHQLSSAMLGIFIHLLIYHENQPVMWTNNIHGPYMAWIRHGLLELQVPSLSGLVRSSLTHGWSTYPPPNVPPSQELRPYDQGLLTIGFP